MVNYFIEREREIKPKFSFRGKTRKDFLIWKKAFKRKLIELLGEWPKPVPLKPRIIEKIEKENYIREKVIFDSERYASIPAYLFIPKGLKKGERRPGLLCCHGHGPYGKDSVAGITSGEKDRIENIRFHNYNYAEQFAKKGYLTIAPDWRCFGERSDGGNPYPGTDKCNIHFIRGLIMGINLLTLNIWDGMRTIDYLLTRKEVDRDRIGCLGLSFGGTMTTYITVMDERIKAADIICYLTTTKHYAIDTGNFCGSQFLSHMYRYGDVADVVGLIAPRPLLIESGIKDSCFSITSAREAHKKLRRIYKAAGASDRLEFDIFPGEHMFSGRKAFKFFEKWLWNKRD